MKFETILYEKKDNVAWITLNRPEKYNAQNQELRNEVVAALEDARNDDISESEHGKVGGSKSILKQILNKNKIKFTQ